jgi:hypothetical protein
MTTNRNIHLSLTRTEALVLCDLLSRWEQNNILQITDDSEAYVLSQLLNVLDQELMNECFDPDYKALVERAKSEVRTNRGSS